MSPSTIGLLVILVLFALLFFRIPVWVALAVSGITGITALSNITFASVIAGTSAFDTASNYGLTVVPLFILMGEIATGTKLSAELFKAARIILSGMRGGLAVATIGASGAFGAICGSSIATAATMTRIAMPEMRKAGYEDGFAAASVAAGGSLGILIPPSIILVIYASIAEQSVPRLFAASMIPGIILLLLYIAVALVIARGKSGKVPADISATIKERILALKEPWQFILLFIVTIGGIYAGVFSPNEAAAIGAFGAILLGVIGRRLTMKALIHAVKTSVITSSVLFMIVISASIFSKFVVQTKLPVLLIGVAQTYSLEPWMVMTLIIGIYIIMGCFLEGIGMVLITVPVFLPIIVGFGYDPIWFAVIVVVVVELGLIHPPVGMNLFIIQAQMPDLSIKKLYIGILPFLIAPFILIFLLFLFPSIALWLPSILY